MKKFLVPFFLLLCGTITVQSQNSLAWSRYTDSTVSYSSPRACDLNNDGIKDIVIGAGKEYQQTNYGILAIDGATGNSLWTLPARNEVFASAIFQDITGDNIKDVFISGRDAQLYAINGATGNIIWEFFPYPNANPNDSGLYNFYSPQFIPDMNADNVPDLLLANGGDHLAPVWQTNRPPAHLMVIDAITGSVLAKAVVPDSAETYCSPVVSDLQNNGTLWVIYGTGGETLGGSMWAAQLQNDLMNNDLSNSIALASHPTKGFIAPAAVADFSGSGIKDIIIQGYDGTVYKIKGSNFSVSWSKSFPGTESSAGPVIGNFTGTTLIPDIFCVLYKGVAPSYSDYYQVMLDGQTGNVVFKDSIGAMHFVSANAFDSNGDGRDEVLISINNHTGSFKHQLKLIDFQNNNTSNFWNSEAGVNIGCTPLVTDLDNDNKIDVVYAFRADSMNPMGWKGLYVKRLTTTIRIPNAGIAWGSYMGTTENGHYYSALHACPTGNILSGSLTQNPSCNGFSDGKIVPYTTNGIAPFTFLWSNGSVNDTLLNVPAGSYSVIVTDSTGCVVNASANLSDPYVLGFGGVIHNTCQGGSNGQATATSSGCVCMFSGCNFVWSTGQTGYTATGLSAGVYTVTITHGSGCVVTNTITINDGLPMISSNTVNNVSCSGLSNGSINLQATDPSTATYYWSNAVSNSLNDSLSPGNYSVIVNDSRNCPDTLNFTITEPGALNISTSSTAESASGMSDGTATTIVTGGTPGYTYQWNDAGAQTSNPATGLTTGNYIVMVTDANGCTIADTIFVDVITGFSNQDRTSETILYPNPAQEFIYLSGTNQINQVVIYNVEGKLIQLQKFNESKNHMISLKTIASGIYTISIYTEHGIINKKISVK